MRVLMTSLLAGMLPLAAHAATIDFNAAPQGTLFGPSYSEAGYTLTGSNFAFPQSDGWAFSTYANDGTLAFNYKGPTYTLTRDGGGAFDFSSFQLGNLNGNTNGGTLQVAFNGGSPSQFAIPLDSMLQTFTLNAMNVTSVAFSFLPGEDANNSLNSYARIDNLVVNSAAAVPEPASWMMLIAGFGITGYAFRRRSYGRTTAAA